MQNEVMLACGALLLAFVCGALWQNRLMNAVLQQSSARWRALLQEAQEERREATNRLFAAWRDGYHIPEPAAEPVEEEPLPPALQDWLSQWEDPAARERFEADIRRKLAQGRTVDQLLMDLEVAS